MNANRNARAQQRHVQRLATNTDACGFFNLLTSAPLFEQVESLLPAHRERLFPPTETLSMFCAQALNQDRSCQQAVDSAAIKRHVARMRPCSTYTGAYCRARKRLPETMISTLMRHTGRAITHAAPASWQWHGRPVRLVDGTTLTMPDTPTNQAAYPQSHNQQPGLGFPICRLVGIVCLGSGALLNATICPYQGKGHDEQSMLRAMLDTLNSGDVLVGDAFYATYFLLCTLIARGIDGVFEQHGSRQRMTDFRCGKKLGARDHLIVFQKPIKKPYWMHQDTYEQAPDTLTVRECRVGGKTLVTTLLCHKQTSKAELKSLYRNRWHVELDIRNIKTTLGMAHLSCVSPAMIVKEIWVYLLAYNLIRMMMAEAACYANCLPRQISFKHAVQLCMAMLTCSNEGFSDTDKTQLLALIAQQRVGNRADRVEPRAVKRRPKPYTFLSVPRDIARAKIRKSGHPVRAK